ncbi:phospholipid-translocating ATPase rsb1 [Teratosphaeriaceae sp. CCFEE 6253]|nr:phospholipid-translocating ATPase rsb1 [Teratosphaeriaceae sp. CCFEE 6253]
MAIDPFAGCNPQILDNDCTLATCCLAQSSFLYIPNLGGNIFFAVFLGALLLPQLYFGIKHKTWGFLAAMVMGLALEVVGYANRVLLHNNPFNGNAFLIYLITLTIAPVFVSAAIYLSLTRILVLYGQNLSRVTPRIVAISFMSSDFMSLLLQAAGGGIADSANTDSLKNIGVDIMIAGLVLQAISLGVFLLFGADFAWRCRRGVLDQDPERRRTRNSMIFKAFLAGMILATLVILIRRSSARPSCGAASRARSGTTRSTF